MDVFEYPLDTKTLIRKKNSLRRQLKDQPGLIHKNIAVLGGSTTDKVVEQLENFLLYYGIEADFYQSEYGQYWQDAMFGSPHLDSFEPDIIYIHTNWRNVTSFPEMTDDEETIGEKLQAEFSRYTAMWQALEDKFHCVIIQNNFDRPDYRLLGNRDIWDIHGRSLFLARLNQLFYQYAQDHSHFYINDIDYLAADYGLTAWNDARHWSLYKCAMCMDAMPYVARSVALIIKALYGKNKKVLALDLDNTLWGGVVGDDGVEGIKIGPEVATGQVYLEFQQYVKKLKDIGVILTVDSKNDEANALAGLNHPDGALRPDDFVAIRANWDPKDVNLSDMASELTLGVDSFVFADDNPAERAIVKGQLPQVAVPAMDSPEDYIANIDHGGYFEAVTISAEDMKKSDMYKAKAAASRAVAAFSDYGDYLDSLDMTAYITDFEPIYQQRIAQLTGKSNQFNLTTRRCSEDHISAMAQSPDYICLCGRLTDTYADNGIVTVVAGKLLEDALDISLWLMSCRVLKRGLEDAMMNTLVAEAAARGISTITGHFYPTAKNAMVKDFYGAYGFDLVDEDHAGNRTWQLKVADYEAKSVHMKITREVVQ